MKVYVVEIDNHEPWEDNRYILNYYLYEEDANKRASRWQLDNPTPKDSYDYCVSVYSIEVVDRKENK